MNNKEPINILLVDDHPARLLSYETILADLGENLIRAGSGKEALEQLLKNEIAVVLVDVCMPELDGFELAEMIRRHPRFQKTAIILVSGVFVEDTDRLKGYGSGAMDYVSVPIVPEILRAKVGVFADLYRKTEALQKLNEELEHRVAERTAEIQASAARLRQSEERLRLVLSATGIQAWTWNLADDTITWVIAAGSAEQASQSSADFYAAVHPEDRAAVRDAFERAVQGVSEYYAEFRIVDGVEEQWWLGRGTILTDSFGQAYAIAGVNINITGRKRAEQERAVLLKNAEDARRDAERANQLKDEFLATLSHELRNPLNAITGWAHMLRSGTLDPATQRKALDTINRNAMLQTQLISDILDVSRIASGKLRLELKPVDLRSVIHNALDTIRPAAEAKNIQIDSSLCDLAPITGDPARLQQVVSNLLSNAIKFTPVRGHVQLDVVQSGEYVQLSVQDDGPGIPAEFLPYIFERFRQGDSSSTRSHQGLGLGLAIARHLVELHGGRIVAMNRATGSGALFKVFLPLHSHAGAASIPDQSDGARQGETWLNSVPSLDGVRLVIVDDDADAREVVALVLRSCGAEVMVATSAAEAYALVERKRPDMLVADIEMPGEDGYSLIRRIQALPAERGGNTPAIALTGYASTRDQSKVLAAGFRMHVPKPIQPADLIKIVANIVGSACRQT